MDKHTRCTHWLPTLGLAFALSAPAAFADVTLEGEVALDYYVAEVDDQGFELVDTAFYAERIQNSDASPSGPLSLWAWLTTDADPAGEGTDVADSPVGSLPGSSSLLDFEDVVPADDAAPGEYFVHTLLQDDDFPGTYDDYRTLSPRMLWRGGLEAVGPLQVYTYDGGAWASVDFAELRNNRVDARFTNDIVLTLYATQTLGPAADGYTLCAQRVGGLYAGDSRFGEGFDCALAGIPDGEYTVHLEVAEAGGRGGYSTITGPDVRVTGGRIDDGYGVVYYASGALDIRSLLVLLLALPALIVRRSKAMNALKTLSLSMLLALPLAAGAATRPATPFTDAEIDQMLAPIALYPDSVLSHVLIAATVPEDVDAAAEWLDRHPKLKGQAAVDAAERMPWDPSVKALLAFPDVIDRMHEDPDWTEDLGLAFLEQEGTVMDRVQVLRDRAYDNGTLDEVEHVKVVREREYIYIEPAVRGVFYVPYYDPWYVYGRWWWASYPPHCWSWWAGYPARYYYGHTFFWGVSYRLGPTWYAGSFNWPHRHVVVTRPHRYYAPSPGYSGRSTMRRDNVRHDLRRSHDSRGWRHDARGRTDRGSRREEAPVRRGHRNHRDDGETHLPQGPRNGRRTSQDVLAQLDAGREGRRHVASNERRDRATHRDDASRVYESLRDGSTRRADNSQRRDGGQRGERGERATRSVDIPRASRSSEGGRGQVQREGRSQPSSQHAPAPVRGESQSSTRSSSGSSGGEARGGSNGGTTRGSGGPARSPRNSGGARGRVER